MADSRGAGLFSGLIDNLVVLDAAFLRAHRVDRVVHGDDCAQADFFAVPLEMGIMRYLPYTPGISTTEIIRRIRDLA